jgi:hypothetical protein
MPDFDDLFDDDSDVQGTDLVKQLRSALRKANTELKEAREASARAERESRSRSLADVLKEKGLDAKVAKLYPSDADATAEAVDAWLGEYGDVFGIAQAAPETTATPEQIQAARAVSGAAASAPAAVHALDVNALLAEIRNASSEAELDEAYKKAGLK